MSARGAAGWTAMIAVALSAAGASAQESNDELIAAHAVKLTKAELQSLVPGSKAEYTGGRGTYFGYEHEADGTLSGYASNALITAGANSPGRGSWRITDDGQYCIDSVWGRSQPTDVKWCAAVYKLGTDYFFAYKTIKPVKVRFKK